MDIKSNEQDQDDKGAKTLPEGEQTQPKRQWRPQILGAMIGAFCFMVLGGLANQLGWQIGQTDRLLLWGAVIGGIVGSADSLAAAGSNLTKSDNRWLNILVALLGMIIIFSIIYGLSSLSGQILSIFNL